jgi:hypothetical protein
VVAFLRATGSSNGRPAEAWLLNLLNGAERKLTLPDEAGPPLAIAWADDGGALLLRTERGTWWLAAPPAPGAARPLTPDELPAADRAFEVWVGDPPFARIVPCPGAAGLCVQGDSGTTTMAPGGREPLPWGADSVAFLEGELLVVRPVGPGRARSVRWPSRLDGAREATAFLGRRPGS